MERENLYGLKEKYIQEILIIISSKEEDVINGLMEKCIKDNGRIIKWMGKDN